MRTIAPAKINWTLEVLGKRDDGYHEVRTVLQTVDLCDELTVEAADALVVSGSPVGREDDLIARSARGLAAFAGREPRVSIRVKKRIPVAAGLGGGSSDAAATLRALKRLWGLDLSDGELTEIGASLGTDVPFFLSGGAGVGSGRGEEIASLPDVPATWLVLLTPPIGLADKTKQMYASLTEADFTDGSRTAAVAEAIRAGGALTVDLLYNAVERAAYRIFDGLEGYREALLSAGARSVHLAGAGPTLFAIADGEDGALEMRDRLSATAGRAYAARTLTASESTAIDDA